MFSLSVQPSDCVCAEGSGTPYRTEGHACGEYRRNFEEKYPDPRPTRLRPVVMKEYPFDALCCDVCVRLTLAIDAAVRMLLRIACLLLPGSATAIAFVSGRRFSMTSTVRTFAHRLPSSISCQRLQGHMEYAF